MQQVRATDEAGIVRGRTRVMSAVLVVAAASSRTRSATACPTTCVFFAVLLMAASFLLAQLTAGQDVKIIKDLGLAAASSMLGCSSPSSSASVWSRKRWSGAASTACCPSRSRGASSSRQVPRPGVDAAWSTSP